MTDTLHLLEKHFDTAFAAPDGVKKLRELILTLAMQGKLVPQDPNDEPASELLKKIEAEKERLIQDGKLKKAKPLPEIKPEEVPYDLPEGWEWVRLNDIGIWKSGTTPSRNNSSYYGGNIAWVKSGEVKQGRIFETDETITQEALRNCSLEINPVGSVLVAMYGANIGDVGILEIEATTNQAVCACQTYKSINNIFLSYLLTELKQNFVDQGAGAAQPNISRQKIIHTIFAIPPLAEQKRIVEKIDRLMARCDELEQKRSLRDQKRITVHRAAINCLLNSPEDDGRAWQFIAQNFKKLYSTKENITELRKAILQLGVMGKLVPQDPNDEPASELLKAIEAEKERLIQDGKIKKSKTLPISETDIIPYKAPHGWEWVKLGSITNIVRGGSPRPAQDPRFYDGDIPFLKVADLTETLTMYVKKYSYSIKEAGLKKTRMVPPNTLMLTNSGATLGIPKICEFQTTFNDGIAAFIFMNEELYKPFFYYFLLSKTDWFLYKASRGQGQPNLNTDIIGQTLIALPPFAEQKRIVEKIDRLMALCDRLERHLEASTHQQTRLLEAVMALV